MDREVRNEVQGFETVDGAGVHLVRVLAHDTTEEYDPFLMLDSFDSTNPEDYEKGFPLHPHRGIETISYLKSGRMIHKDTLGNKDEIEGGQVQWMTAGSGILHEEMLPPADRMLGVQLWLNLPKEKKMTKPFYHSLKELPKVDTISATVEIISGEFNGVKGFKAPNHPLEYYSVEFTKDGEFSLDVEKDDVVVMFTLLGEIKIADKVVKEKTAITTTDGDRVVINAKKGAIVLVLISKRLNEEIHWGGPIVMNTKEDLRQAFVDLKEDNFLKEKAIYEQE